MSAALLLSPLRSSPARERERKKHPFRPTPCSAITEYQSFTDLVYSKNKNVYAIEWVPGRRGSIAVSCTEAMTFDERVEEAGRSP